MIRALPGDAPTLTPAPNSSHPQVLETVMTLTKYMHLTCLLSGDPCVCECFFTSIIFCDRHANKSYDIFKTFGDREVICWGSGHSQNTWYAHGIFDIEELEDKNFFFINSICQQYSGVWVLKGVLKGRKGLKLLSNKRFLPFCPWLSTLVILISQQAFSVFSSFLDFSTVKEKNNRISCYVNSHMFFSRMVNQFWRV